VTRDYANAVRGKSVCLPHVFNEDLYCQHGYPANEKIILRYIGNFYGKRQPYCLLKALRQLSSEYRAFFRIEFIGISTDSLLEMIQNYGLDGVVFINPPVSYLDSLNLMSTADVLLIIDAPTERSPFLPSKLIDYIGANKPIF
jgi:hypothetical protein